MAAQLYNSDIWNSVLAQLKNDKNRKQEIDSYQIKCRNNLVLKYHEKYYGSPGPQGYSLFVCLHGGGGCPKKDNDDQWRTIILFEDKGFINGTIAVAPRGITDTWNLHFVDESFPAITRLIENYIIFKNVNPNKVYLMGFSAGGDGTYNLTEKIPYLFAACSPQGGHPNDVEPRNLSNLPMYLACGELDRDYKRNEVCVEFYNKIIKEGRDGNLGNYVAKCEIVGNSPHSFQCWQTPRNSYFNGAKQLTKTNETAFTFMYSFTRNPMPSALSINVDRAFNLNPLRNFYTNRGNTFYYVEIGANQPKEIQLSIDYNRNTVNIKKGTNFKLNFISDYFKGNKQITIVEENRRSYQIQLVKDPDYIRRNMSLYCDPYYGFDSYVIIGNIGNDPYQRKGPQPQPFINPQPAPAPAPAPRPIINPTPNYPVQVSGVGDMLVVPIGVNIQQKNAYAPVQGTIGQYVMLAKNGSIYSFTKFADTQFAWSTTQQYWVKKRMNNSLAGREVFHLNIVNYLDPKGNFKCIKPADYFVILRHNPFGSGNLRLIGVKVKVDGVDKKGFNPFTFDYNQIIRQNLKGQLVDQYIMKIHSNFFNMGMNIHEIAIEMFSEGDAKTNWDIDGFILIPVNNSNRQLNQVYNQYFDHQLICYYSD